VIGPGGTILKRIQNESGARVALPPRDREGDTVVSGQKAVDVMRACLLIAELTGSDGLRCECELLGSTTAHATLCRPTGQPYMFRAVEGAPVAFAAVYLVLAKRQAVPLDATTISEILDGVSELRRLPPSALQATCFETQPGSSRHAIIAHAVGDHDVVEALDEASRLLCDRFDASVLPADRSQWLPDKRSLSSDSYVSDDGVLRECDAVGFRAAGAILWRRLPESGEPVALMASEARHQGLKLNFLGGKRDAIAETPAVVAARECGEETLEELSEQAREAMRRGMAPAAWCAQSMYCLFLHELAQSVRDAALDKVPPDAKQRTLHWVPFERLLERTWAQENLHSFTRVQVGLLRAQLAAILGRPLTAGRAEHSSERRQQPQRQPQQTSPRPTDECGTPDTAPAPSSSRQESRAHTVYAALQRLNLLSEDDRVGAGGCGSVLRIDIIGADHREGNNPPATMAVFAPLCARLAGTRWSVLELLLCGPNCRGKAGESTVPELVAGGTAAAVPKVRVHYSQLPYEAHLAMASGAMADGGDLPRAHLAVAFNAGVWGYDSWRPCIEAACADSSCPLVITAYNELEAEEDEDTLCSWGVSSFVWPPEANPCRSHVQEPRAGAQPHPQYENASWMCIRGPLTTPSVSSSSAEQESSGGCLDIEHEARGIAALSIE
jgi:hypothetical protein